MDMGMMPASSALVLGGVFHPAHIDEEALVLNSFFSRIPFEFVADVMRVPYF